MTWPITITNLKLEGFRAYLKPKTFKLHKKSGPLSLAVFAPNGKGKSSMVDALEYYFHKYGSLERLGRKSTANRAGIDAVRHVDAEELGVKTSVSMQFKQGNDEFGDSRPFLAPLTDSAERILRRVNVPFVIRGHELRRLVDDTSPTALYDDLAVWLDLNPLLEVQKKMERHQLRVGKAIADEREEGVWRRYLEDITNGAVHAWDEHAILEWLNESILAPLDASIKFNALSKADPALQELERGKWAELEHAGPGIQKKLLDEIDVLLQRQAARQGDPAGKIHAFERSVSAFKDAADNECAARSAVDESAFSEVWECAERLLGGDSKLDRCPICDAEFSKSPSGSRHGVYATLGLNLNVLKGCRAAKAASERAKADLRRVKRELEQSLDRLLILADSRYEYDAVAAYWQTLRSWNVVGAMPDSGPAIQTLTNLRASVLSEIERMSRQRDNITYHNAHEKVRRLLYLKGERDRIRKIKDDLQADMDDLRRIKTSDPPIAGYVRHLVDEIADEAGAIYEGIQGPCAEAPRIQIRLAVEGDALRRSAELLIDFAGRKGVAPGGYLSDSQMHTLALSVRLAAIRRYNAEFKVIALDDVVTSYDADHRKRIAAVLNDRFGEFQIILTTHDRQFFDMLREHLDEKHWKFKRIKELRPGIGPIFVGHRTRDEDIEVKINAGEDPANDIRQAEEKWLDTICHDFATPTTFGRNKNSSMSEMAISLHKFLKGCGLESPTIPGHSMPFLQSMQRANVENKGSHYRNDPYASPSEGDTRTRWEEFKTFRGMFKCAECGGSRFVRPDGWKKPACRRCKTSFSFG